MLQFPCQFSFHRLLHNHHHLPSWAGIIGQLVAYVRSGSRLTQPHEIRIRIKIRTEPLIKSRVCSTSPPQRCLHLVVEMGLVRLCDPESNAGGSLTTSRATHAGKVKGYSLD
jgi:hypothetical protein